MKKILAFLEIIRSSLKGDEANILSGNINRAILMLAIPMMLEMLMESLFAVVDIFFVSKVGVNAVAVVGLTESMLSIVYSIGWGLALGVTALVARRIGEGNIKGASEAAIQAIYLAILISIPLGAGGYFFAEDLLRLMGASASVISDGSGFTKIILALNGIIILLFLINGIFRGAGDAAIAMRSLWLANALNIVLDPLFIFGIGPFPKLGVEGVAVATSIGRFSGICYQLYHLFKGKGIIKIRREDLPGGEPGWFFKKDILIKIFNLSSGVTGQFIISSASWIFLMRIISIFGSTAVAGYTIAIRIVVFTILPAWGISNAAATMVGQNLGAGQPDRAQKSVWKTSQLNMLFMGSVMFVFLFYSESIVKFFTGNQEVIYYAKSCLFIMAPGYLFYAFGMVIMQAFNGAGDTKTPTIMNFFIFWVLQIPLAYLLAIQLSAKSTGVFLAIVISESVFSIVGFFLFRRGKWKDIRI